MLVKYARVENSGYAVVRKPLHMAVGELRGVTLGFRGNRLHAKLVYFSVGQRRQHRFKAKLVEKCRPKRIIFVHIENPRNTDDAAGRVFGVGEIKNSFELIFDHVRRFRFCALARALFTAVARDMASAAGETVDCEHAVV